MEIEKEKELREWCEKASPQSLKDKKTYFLRLIHDNRVEGMLFFYNERLGIVLEYMAV